MAINILAGLGAGLAKGLEASRQYQDPLGEAQLAFNMQKHREMQPYYDAQRRGMEAEAETAEYNLDAGRRQTAQQGHGELQLIIQDKYGGDWAEALKDPVVQNRFAHNLNMHPQAGQFLGEGRQLSRFEVFDVDDAERLGALGWDDRSIAEFRRTHGDGREVLIPIVRNSDGSEEPLENPDDPNAIDIISEHEARQIAETLFLPLDAVGGAFEGAQSGNEELGGTFTISNGGSSPQPSLTSIDPGALGHLTIERESRGNPAAINSGEVDGSASYGPLQFNSRGALSGWLSTDGQEFAPMFEGLTPGTPEFNRRWEEVASDPQVGQAITESQRAYAQRELFEPLAARAQGAGVNVDNPGIQEALFSTSIQHSPAGQERILERSLRYMDGDTPSSDREFLDAFYQARKDYVRFDAGLPEDTVEAIEQHYDTELAKAKRLFERAREQRRRDEAPVSSSVIDAIDPDQMVSRNAISGAIQAATGHRQGDVRPLWERIGGFSSIRQSVADVVGNASHPLSSAAEAIEEVVGRPASAVTEFLAGTQNRDQLASGYQDYQSARDAIMGAPLRAVAGVIQPGADSTPPMYRIIPADEVGALPESQRDQVQLDPSGDFAVDYSQINPEYTAYQEQRRGPQPHDTQVGFTGEEIEQARTNIGRRIQNDRGLGPGVAKRAADNPEVVEDVRRTTTPDQIRRSAESVLDGLEPSGEKTYRSTSTTGRPTSEQRGHVLRLFAAGLVTREEMIRFNDTGALTTDAVGLIERGMMESGAAAQEEIKGRYDVAEEQVQQAGQTEREREKRRAEGGTVSETIFEHGEKFIPRYWDLDPEDPNTDRKINQVSRDLLNGAAAWSYDGELYGTPDNVDSFFQGYYDLEEAERNLEPGVIEKFLLGRRGQNLTQDPTAQALASLNTGLFSSGAAAERTANSLERYRQVMRDRQDPRVNDPKFSTQAMVNFHILADEAEDIDLNKPGSPIYDKYLQAAIVMAERGDDPYLTIEKFRTQSQGSSP